MLVFKYAPNGPAGQGGQFSVASIVRCPALDLGAGQKGRVAVQLGDAGLQAGQEAQQVETEQGVRPDDAGCGQLVFRMPGQTGEHARLPAFTQPGAWIEGQATGQIFPGQPHGPDAVLLGQLQQAVQDNGVQVDVDVAVNVGQRQTGGQKAFDLRPAFIPDLGPGTG